MRYYLKSAYRAALKAFQTMDTSDVDAICAHNEKILADLFEQLLNGEISYFFQSTDTNLVVWHRSTRPGIVVQESHIWKKDGELIPLSHFDINSFDDMLRHQGYHKGYITAKN